MLLAERARGIATLRRHVFGGGARPFSGRDLYLDDGRHFYGPTAAALNAAVDSGAAQDSRIGKVLKAAAAANELDPAAGRERMLDASLAPAFRAGSAPPGRDAGAPLVPHTRASLDIQLCGSPRSTP